MKRRTLFVLLLVLGLALLSCNWATPLRSWWQATPTPASLLTPAPAENVVSPTPHVQGGTISEEELLTDLYQRVSPSVVHIQVTQRVARQALSPFDEWPEWPFHPNLPDLPQIPDEFYRRGEGSGFVWDDQGHIVTNHHVVVDATAVEVHFFDNTVVEGQIVGLDEQSDIAVLRVDPSTASLQPVSLGDSDTLQVGQLAVAIGNPFGQTWTMTRGIISALGRTIRAGSNPFAIPEMIQTDAAINPGNSGGPLLNSQGKVIGMNTMILSQTGASAGVGFAVPINIVKQVVPELIASGEYAYPWLGIEGRDLLPEDLDTMDLPVRQGALIVSVTQDGPADKAGLRGSDRTIVVDGVEMKTGGDVIVKVDGTPVKGMDDVIAYLVRHTRPEQQVTLEVIRDSEPLSVKVTLGQRPKDLGQ